MFEYGLDVVPIPWSIDWIGSRTGKIGLLDSAMDAVLTIEKQILRQMELWNVELESAI
jgi:hypothetical protein